MKKDWEIKKLSEVCEINIGRTPERGNSKMWDKEKKTENVWLSIADLNNAEDGYISDSSEYVSDNAVPKMKLVKANTLLMSFKLTIGRCAITKRELFTNEAIAALPIIDKDLDLFFLKYYLENFDWAKLTEGDVKVKGKTLNKEKLKEVPITVPPREEQKRIVKILDEKIAQLETIKTNAQTNLQNAKDLFQSQLTKAFSNNDWEKKRLGDVCIIRPPKAEIIKHLKESDEVSFLPMEDLQIMNYYIEPKQSKTLKEVSGSYTCFADGDVLLAKVTPCFENGKQGIAKDLDNGVGFGSSEYIVFRPSEKILSEYIYYVLATPEFKEGGKKNLLGACGLKRLSKDYVNTYEIPLPPLPEQKRIVEQLDSLSEKTKALQNIYEQMLLDCNELKQSFLCKAFAGEL